MPNKITYTAELGGWGKVQRQKPLDFLGFPGGELSGGRSRPLQRSQVREAN
jgi:hypothetical protein